ncbi:MAG: hypothetical protein VXW87_01675 [Pseudomonadota bacterium]|nr:hypothetical protein [Pseudomonadota bacterium]
MNIDIGVIMELGRQKIWVKDINLMIKDYEAKLMAKILDQTETSVLLAIDDELLEFIIKPVQSKSIVSIQFSTESAFRQVCSRLTLDMKIVQELNHNLFQAGYTDAEGNLVKLYFHQVYIPVSLDAELQ